MLKTSQKPQNTGDRKHKHRIYWSNRRKTRVCCCFEEFILPIYYRLVQPWNNLNLNTVRLSLTSLQNSGMKEAEGKLRNVYLQFILCFCDNQHFLNTWKKQSKPCSPSHAIVFFKSFNLLRGSGKVEREKRENICILVTSWCLDWWGEWHWGWLSPFPKEKGRLRQSAVSHLPYAKVLRDPGSKEDCGGERGAPRMASRRSERALALTYPTWDRRSEDHNTSTGPLC